MPDTSGNRARPAGSAPVSFQQRQIWLAEHGAHTDGLYNEACALRLSGKLLPRALNRALAFLVERHEALRTVFPLDGAEPVQLVRPAPSAPCGDDIVDLRHLPGDARQLRLLDLIQRQAEAPFDLAAGPLLRWSLFRLDTEEHVLLLTVHHIVCDGWSLRLLLRELADRYEQERTGKVGDFPAPLGSYLDYALEQRALASQGAWDAQLALLREEFDGAPTALELLTDNPRPAVKRYRGRRDAFPLDRRTEVALARLAARASGSRLAALTAVFAALVHRCTGRTDLVIGTGTDPRPARFADTVGLFAGVVPLRLRPTGGATVRQLLDGTCDAVFDALDSAAIPFEKAVESLRPIRDPSHPQLVQMVCTIWDRDYRRMEFGGLQAELLDVPRGRARFDLMVESVHDTDSCTVYVEYDTALYEAGTIGRLMRHWMRLIEAAAADPDASIASLALLDAAEEAAVRASRQVVCDTYGNVAPVGAPGILHETTVTPDGVTATAPTGWCARRTPDGRVERLGLLARRVRLGDLDVQLEHLESVLCEHPAVRDAAVVLPEAARRPVAYVVPQEPGADCGTEALCAHLETRLPRAYLPVAIMPVTTIERRADTSPDISGLPPIDPDNRAPASRALEQAVTDVWAALLPAEQIGPHDDFFALGGRSMLAAHAAQQLSEVLGVKVQVRDVFTHPTVRDLVATLTAQHPALAASAEPVRNTVFAAGTPLRSPVSTAQLQIWLNEQLTLGAADDFNSAFAHHLRGPLDVSALRLALQRTVARHAALRTWFKVMDDLPEQRFADTVEVDLPLIVLDRLPPEDRMRKALALARDTARQRFSIERAPLLRALLINLAPQEHVLVLALHHLVTDGVSMGVIHRDLKEWYTASVEGRAPELPPVAAPYAEYVVWERDWLAGPDGSAARAYWRHNLAGMTELGLPVKNGGERRSLAVGSCRRTLTPDTGRRLAALARQCGATTFMTVTAALAVVLQRWSGQRDLVIGTLVDNRPLSALRDTVGCFAGFVPMRIAYEPDLTFRDLISRVRDKALDAYDHQHLPFSEIVQATGARRSFTRMPIFQTTVQQVRPDQQALRLPGCSVRQLPVTPQVSRFELTLFVIEDPQSCVLELEFATDLWDAADVEARADRLLAVLEAGCAAPGTLVADLAG